MRKPISNISACEAYIYNNVFSEAECKRILSEKAEFKTAGLMIDQKNTLDKKVRNVLTSVMKPSPQHNWIVQKLLNVVQNANLKYNFQLLFLSELQILRYDSGSFYNWHIDLVPQTAYASRKLSLITFLNPASEYEGGQLKFNLTFPAEKDIIEQNHGTVVVFPSYLPHMVEPVSKGSRYVLVSWMHGDTFR